jgi:PTS system mannose-specific IIA component
MSNVESPSVGVVVISHGMFATELLNAAEMIVGDLPGFIAVSIGWHDDVDVAREAIAHAIEKVNAGRGVLLLTDMFGGTPSNLGLTFLEAGRVELVTGANLPMLIKLARTPPGQDLIAVARSASEHGRIAIRVASDLMRGDADVTDRIV